MDDYIQYTIDTASVAIEQTWDFIASSSQTANLHELPTHVKESLTEMWYRLSQHNTLPSLEWKDLPGVSATPFPPPPPPPTVLSRIGDTISGHPYLFTLATTSTLAGGTYYFFPAAFIARLLPIIRPLKPFVPLQLLPTSARPLRVTGPQGETRKEAVLVLGAEGLGREIALDLERRGYVLIATVRDPREVDVLEKKSRGWMKVLVLDSTDASSVAPFLRSLNTALSLRFPLHTSGDPFSRPSHALALTSVVNCLSLHANPESLRPIEGIETDEVRRNIGEQVAVVVGVLRGVMPILRTMGARPSAPEIVVLSLLPSTTSNVALPFLSLSSASDAAITSLFHSLRRELTASRTSNIRIAILETGFFDLPQSPTSTPASPGASPRRADPISLRLSSIYAPALARRHYLGNARAEGRRRKGSPSRKLCAKVFEILVYGRGGATSRVGAGASTYHLTSLLPHFLIDRFLSFQDRLASIILTHRARLLSAPSHPLPTSPTQTQRTPRASSRPLPTPPMLRPGHTLPGKQPQVDPFSVTPHANEEGDDSGSDEGKSSIEDFGVASGLGSFVGSEAGWRDGEADR